MNIRHYRPEDLDAVLALNNAEAKWVGLEEKSFFETYQSIPQFNVAIDDEKVCAFLMAMGPEVEYESLNFHWFKERLPNFAYIDRVVVEPTKRNQGIASKLYQDLFARNSGLPIVCEVAINPPNQESIQFHEKRGFRGMGTFSSDGHKECTMYIRRQFQQSSSSQ
ncbi:MAG: GNAT family N-acetyltransferase [Nanoarchaeota archaeon]